jgi:hypothetical protein
MCALETTLRSEVLFKEGFPYVAGPAMLALSCVAGQVRLCLEMAKTM